MIELIAKALPGRARWFDLLETKGTTKSIVFKNSRIHSASERESSGRGVRVNIGGRTGFFYTNKDDSLGESARRAAELSPYGDIENFDIPEKIQKNFDPYSGNIRKFDLHREIAVAEGVIGAILAEFPGASVDISVSATEGSVRIANSRGADAAYIFSRYSFGVSATYILDSGGRVEVWEAFSSPEPERSGILINRAINSLRLARKESKIPSGKIPVILTPKAFSRIIGILLSGLNGKSVFKGISPFAGKTGEKIFNAGFSLSDDSLLEGSPASYPFDDEGVAGRTKEIIHQGIIAQFVTDLNYASKLGTDPTGNGSRGYASMPVPSFSNVLVKEGSVPCEDLIKNVKRGILVDQFIGLGQSNTITGEFSTNLDLAFLIENGEITGRIKDCMISDNLFQMLSEEIILSMERIRYGSIIVPFVLFPEVSFTG